MNRVCFFIFFSIVSLLQCVHSPDLRTEIDRDKIFWTYIPYEEGAKKNLTADHYIFSNERRIDFFEPYLRNIGGGYIGVGTDQNLTLAAWAKSEYVWLIDFDPYSVRVNEMHLSILKRCPVYECFRRSWDSRNHSTTWNWIREDYEERENFAEYKEVFDYASRREHIPSRLNELQFMTRNFGFQSFHNRIEDYDHLYSLAIRNRIRPVKGDITKIGTFRHITNISKEMQLVIRIFYTSNAEDYFSFNQEYRENVISIPSDEVGYHVRTLSVGAKKILGYPQGEKYEDYPFHYNLQKIKNMQAWMRDSNAKRALDIMKGRTPIAEGFSIQNQLP